MNPETEGQKPMPDKKRALPIIRVDMDKASQADYQRLVELGWTKGSVHPKAAEYDFTWLGDGEPVLPPDIAAKVYGKLVDGKDEKIEYLE